MKYSVLVLIVLLVFINLSQQQKQTCQIQSCLECDQTLTVCNRCENNYYLSKALNKCVYLQQCQSGFYLDDKENTCKKCDQSCSKCLQEDSHIQCLNCNQGYYLQIQQNLYTCLQCNNNNCKSCKAADQCSECADGYYLKNLDCTPCNVVNCVECQLNPTLCTKCKESHEFHPQFKSCLPVGLCQVGYYAKNINQCAKCHKSCHHCFGSSETECYSCQQGYFMDNNRVCQQCNSQCEACKFDQNHCTLCQLNYFAKNGECKNQCNEINEFYNQAQKRCQDCTYPCQSCQSENLCTSCIDPIQYQLLNGKCVKRCEIGSFTQIDSNKIPYWLNQYLQFSEIPQNYCQQCSANCVDCNSDINQCTNCKSNFVLLEGQCVEQCPDGYYQDGNYCKPCQYPCTQCTAQLCTQCDSKIQQFALLNGQCQININGNQCKQGQLQFQDICLQKCTNGLIQNGQQCNCDQSCSKCKINIPSQIVQCFQCQNNDHYEYLGICYQQCPSGTFKSEFNLQGQKIKSCIKDTVPCPQNMFTYYSSTEISCLQQCPLTSIILENKKCLEKICPTDHYFQADIPKLISFFDTQGQNYNFDALSQNFCQKCQENCKRCLGQNNCQICNEGFSLQYKNDRTTSCQEECASGYLQKEIQTYGEMHKVCNACKNYCKSCALGLFRMPVEDTSDLFDCLPQCPLGYRTSLQTCKSYGKSLELTVQGHEVGQKLSPEKSTYIQIQLDDKSEIGQNWKIYNIECTYVGKPKKEITALDGQVLTTVKYSTPIEQFDLFQQKFRAVISPQLLDYDQSYQVRCQVVLNETFIIRGQIQFNTISKPSGVFDVQPKVGVAQKDSFNVAINSWKLDQQQNSNADRLSYKIFIDIYSNIEDEKYQEINKKYDSDFSVYTTQKIKNRILLYEVSEDFNENIYRFEPPLNLAYSFKMPPIAKDQNVQVILEVTSDSINIYQSVNIFVKANQDINTLQQVIQKTQQDLPIDELKLLVYSFEKLWRTGFNKYYHSSIQYSQIKNNITFYKMVKNNNFKVHKLMCDDDNVCNGQGTCKTLNDIQNSFNICTCKNDFGGAFCDIKQSDIPLGKQFIEVVLSKLQTHHSGELNKLQKARDFIIILKMISSFTDIIDTSSIEKIYGFSVQSINIVNFDLNIDILMIFDNIYESLRRNNQNNQLQFSQLYEYGKKIRENFDNIMYQIAQYLSYEFQDNKKIYLNNFQFLISNLIDGQFSLGLSKQILQMDNNNFDNIINYDQYILTPQQLKNTFISYFIIPLDFYGVGYQDIDQSIQSSNFPLIFSNIYSLSFRSILNNQPISLNYNQQDFSHLSIQVKRVTLFYDFISNNDGYTMTCMYWNQASNNWDTEGVKNGPMTNAYQECSIGHLTDFSLIIRDYNPENLCTDDECYNGNFDRHLTPSVGKLFGVLNMLFFIILSHSLIIFCVIKRKGKDDDKLNILEILENQINYEKQSNENEGQEMQDIQGAPIKNKNNLFDDNQIEYSTNENLSKRIYYLHSFYSLYYGFQMMPQQFRILYMFVQISLYQCICAWNMNQGRYLRGKNFATEGEFPILCGLYSIIWSWILIYIYPVIFFIIYMAVPKLNNTKFSGRLIKYLLIVGFMIINLIYTLQYMYDLIDYAGQEMIIITVCCVICDMGIIQYLVLVFCKCTKIQLLMKIMKFRQLLF